MAPILLRRTSMRLVTTFAVITALGFWAPQSRGAIPPDVGHHIGKRVVLQSSQGPRYCTITQFLANGAGGEVYRGKELASGNDVAVKVQRDTAIAKGWKDGFDREHCILCAANAPQLIHSLGVGMLDGPTPRRAHVMELAHGDPLKKTAWTGNWSTGNAVRVTMQILRGIRALHRTGMRHNDLHLGNVVLEGRRADTVKVIDAGCASPCDAPLRGWAGATMAPERPIGATAPSNGRVNADVYSAAATLAIMLTGRNPREQRREALAALPNDAAQVNGQTVRLRDVIARGMEPDPAKRYQTAQQLIDALRPFAWYN